MLSTSNKAQPHCRYDEFFFVQRSVPYQKAKDTVYVGASEAAGAIGLPRFPSHNPDVLWETKRTGKRPAESSFSRTAMQYGTDAEPLARTAFARLFNKVIVCPGMFRLFDEPRIGCSPDGLVMGESSGLEIKCPYAMAIPDTLDAIPVSAIIQAIVSARICKADRWYLFYYRADDGNGSEEYSCWLIEDYERAWQQIYCGLRGFLKALTTGTRPKRLKKPMRTALDGAIREGCTITRLLRLGSAA